MYILFSFPIPNDLLFHVFYKFICCSFIEIPCKFSIPTSVENNELW